MLAKGTEFAVDTLLDTLVDGVMSGLAGKEFNFWESLQKNGWANIVAMSIHDPVDAVSGAYVIQTTDVILASLPSALKLERTYRSTSNDVSGLWEGLDLFLWKPDLPGYGGTAAGFTWTPSPGIPSVLKRRKGNG